MPRIDYNVINFKHTVADPPLPEFEELVDGNYVGSVAAFPKLLHLHGTLGTDTPNFIHTNQSGAGTALKISGRLFLLDIPPETDRGAAIWFSKDNINHDAMNAFLILRGSGITSTAFADGYLVTFGTFTRQWFVYRVDGGDSTEIININSTVTDNTSAGTGYDDTTVGTHIKALFYDNPQGETIIQLFMWDRTASAWVLDYDGLDPLVTADGLVPAGVPGFAWGTDHYNVSGIKFDDFDSFSVADPS